jgi:hypothetical protein
MYSFHAQDLDEFVKQNPQVEPEDYHNITKNGKLLDDSKKQSLVSNKKLPKLLMSLGTRDPLVQPSWTQSTFDQLRVCKSCLNEQKLKMHTL